MFSRLLVGLVVLVSLAFAVPAQAAPGALNVLVTGNQSGTPDDLAVAIAAEPGVASATAFDTSSDTPTAEFLAGHDLVVSIGDSSYFDATLWGDLLADYVDAGGAVLQAAYDNWEDSDAAPLGRFDAGGYPPLLRGNNDNDFVTIGSLTIPSHPLVQGLLAGSIPSFDNTTTALAPGATLLAKWSDDRNAIAFKGRVAAISASPGDSQSIPGIAVLARNTGNYLGKRNVSVTKSGTGTGTVTGTRGGAACGESCGGVFPFGTQFEFSATAAPTSHFVGWTGSCSGVAACSPLVAGADLNVGAVFDLSAFGKKALVTLSPVSRKAKSGRIKVRIRNSNPFAVKGSLGGKSGKAKLKAKKFSVKANGSKTVVLKLSKSLRGVLAQKGKLKLALTAKLKAPAGKTRTVKKKISVKR